MFTIVRGFVVLLEHLKVEAKPRIHLKDTEEDTFLFKQSVLLKQIEGYLLHQECLFMLFHGK